MLMEYEIVFSYGMSGGKKKSALIIEDNTMCDVPMGEEGRQI